MHLHVNKKSVYDMIGPESIFSERKIMIVFLLISLNILYVLGAHKNCLIERVLLSTHNISFGSEIRKQFSSGGLVYLCPFSVCVSSESIDETSRMCKLV